MISSVSLFDRKYLISILQNYSNGNNAGSKFLKQEGEPAKLFNPIKPGLF